MSDDPTELPKPGDPETLYILDISGYIFRAYHALPPMSSSRGEPTHAVRGVASMMLKLIKEREPALLCVAVDSRGGSFRKDLYGLYKANREAPPPDLEPQIGRVMEIMRAWGVPLLEQQGYEADDVIATAVRLANDRGWKSVIVSADKDLLQLVGGGVVMYDTMRDRVFGVAETIEKFGVPPEQVRDLLALMGDSSDNVPGVPSVGVKTAAKLLKAHGTLDGLYDALDTVKGKLKEKLTDNKELAYLSQELVTLRDDVNVELDPETLGWDGGDGTSIRELFVELEFNRLLADLDPAPKQKGKTEVIAERAALERAAVAIRDAGELAVRAVLAGADPLEAEMVGVALCWTEGHGVYVPFAQDGSGLGRDEALEILAPLLSNSLFPKFAPDIKREDVAFGRLGIAFRGATFDVSLASYIYDPGRHSHQLPDVARADLGGEVPSLQPLLKANKGAKLDELPAEDVAAVVASQADFTLRVGHLLGPRMDPFSDLYRGLELPLAHVLADMERIGVGLDVPMLESMSTEAEAEIERLNTLCQELAGQAFNVGSPRQLETILFDELNLPVIKKTKTARSTDASVLEELAAQHPLPEAILEHRALTKLKGTYLDGLRDAVNAETGRVHTRYNQAVAATGRLSSSDPNLQNIPIRTELGRRVRNAFVPAEGKLILSADYSQIELRVLAHLSQDPELIDAYTTAEDVHRRTAAALFGGTPAEVTREQRGQGKTVNFAVIYGQTKFALARNLRITKTEAQGYIDAFFERYAGVKRFMDEIVAEAHQTGYVTTLLGRRRALNDIRSRNWNLRSGAERIARNTPIQGTAADIIKLAMVRIHRRLRQEGLASRMILSVHDELVFELPPHEREALSVLVREEMEGAMELSVPLVVEMGVGAHWGAAH